MPTIYSKKNKNLFLWSGNLPPKKRIDVDATDQNIDEFLARKNAEWVEQNPEPENEDDWSNWKDLFDLSEQESFQELLDKLPTLIVFKDIYREEIEILLKDAEFLDLQYRVFDEKGSLRFDFYSLKSKRFVCLSREMAHQVLEECILSTNRDDYFWYLADKYSKKSL